MDENEALRSDQARQTLAATTIARSLFQAQIKARSLSVSSKNLSVVALRIGEDAAGLAVLASFYDELAKGTIRLANRIGELTADIARLAVRQWQLALVDQHLITAMGSMRQDQTLLIEARRSVFTRDERSMQTEFNGLMKKLESMLDEMKQQTQVISVIAVNSKLEATRVTTSRATLNSMAKDIESTTQVIIELIEAAQHSLYSYQSGRAI